MTGAIRDAEAGLAAFVRFVVVACGVIMVSSLIAGVFFRYVVQDSLVWSDEVAMLCFSWMTLLAAALLVREGGHVRVELIEAVLPRFLVVTLRTLIDVAIFIVGLYMVWTGWNFLALNIGVHSAAIRYPMWLRDSSVPVSGALIMIASVVHLLTSANAAEGGDSGAQG